MNGYGVSRRRSTKISPQEGKDITISWEEGQDYIFLRVSQELGENMKPRWIAFSLPFEAWDTLHQFVQQAREDATK